MGKKKEQINPMNEFVKTLDDKAKHWVKLLLDKEDLIDVDYRSKEYETEWETPHRFLIFQLFDL